MTTRGQQYGAAARVRSNVVNAFLALPARLSQR
jgi:hypothetical protein